MTKQKKHLIITAVGGVFFSLLVVGGCRLAAMGAAAEYGAAVLKITQVLGQPGLKDTDMVRKALSEPELAEFHRRVNAMSFLARDYEARMRRLEEGLLYCSGQMSLPEEERFASPPDLGDLHIHRGNGSDEAVAEACGGLALEFILRLNPLSGSVEEPLIGKAAAEANRRMQEKLAK